MNRPTSVKIFGQKYKVKYVPVLEDEGADLLGLTDSKTNTITVVSTLQEDKMASVLMHEITHAIIDESTMSLRRRFGLEEVCDIVGYHVTNVLRDNPSIVEWILKEVEE